MELTSEQVKDELRERLVRLENLNPDITLTDMRRLLELGKAAGEDFFEEASRECQKLLQAYLDSDVKKVGNNIMHDYFALLDQSARLLQKAGEIKKLPSPQEQHGNFSTALVPRDTSDALDYCRIINRADVPKTLVKAADAFRRRNEMVDTVFRIALKVLWAISPEKTVDWIINLYVRHDGHLDPDIVRDTLSTALSSNAKLPESFVQWAIKFASDNNLLEYWPNVVHYADRVICKSRLENWFAANSPKSTLLAQLRLYVRSNRLDDDTLLEWNRHAMEEIGNCVQRFMLLEHSDLGNDWKASVLVSELKRIADLFEPVMYTVDHLLDLPDGTEQMAMAFMGLAGKSLEIWEASLEKYAVRAVKLSFLLDLRANRKPLETIRRLTFGDQASFNAATAELDLESQNFDSMAQRDKVCRLLAVFYASFRRPQILGYEIAKRYRNLMRVVHEDFLGQILDGRQLETVRGLNILPELSSIASEARKYLGKRKASESSLEEVLASKINFERFVRGKRADVCRKSLR